MKKQTIIKITILMAAAQVTTMCLLAEPVRDAKDQSRESTKKVASLEHKDTSSKIQQPKKVRVDSKNKKGKLAHPPSRSQMFSLMGGGSRLSPYQR